LFIHGDHLELHGFRGVGSLSGNVRFDAVAKRMHITPKAGVAGQPAPKKVEYGYEIKADTLTLTDGEGFSVSLQKRRVVPNPLAHAKVEFVEASGINAAGDLLVTQYTVLRAGSVKATYFQPENRALKTKRATILLVQEAGWKKTTVDEARALIRKSTPVAVTYWDDDRPSPHQLHHLWKDMGSPRPDSDAVWRTLSRTLRPGTLVFVLSERENVAAL